MPGIFVVPVNPKSLKVVSTDTSICENVSFSFVCCLERRTNHTNFISETANALRQSERRCYVERKMN